MAILEILALALTQTATVATQEMPPMPQALSEVPVVEFPEKPKHSWRESLKARNHTKGCKPTRKVIDGEYYFVNVLLLADGEGSIRQVTPISINCPDLEEYVANFFARETKNNMPVTVDGKPQWFRSVLKFYW